jgi:hypothetical protein
MKTPQSPKGNQSAPNKRKFTGTSNPRQLRAIAALMRRPISRQELDSVAGCANGPDLISALRDMGLTINCDRIKFTDRDGKPCRPGVYSLTASDRRKVHQWLFRCQPGRGRNV